MSQIVHGCSLKIKNSKEWRTYITWQSMKWRCYNEKRKDFFRYGGRGILVCDKWKTDFSAFLVDMGFKKNGESIGRIDNEKGYCPENCRWETSKQQARNRCSNRFIFFRNKKMTVVEWAEFVGLAKSTLEKRLSNGWSVEKSLTTPPKYQKNMRSKWKSQRELFA
tara:strand:+ start:152 stop:646 length:495 start_codon:yes stop_codon:yes gene_type:complete